MTREEAIKIIQNEYKCVNRECDIERSCGKCPYMIPTKEPILQAYEMAIQALSQEPTNTWSIKDVADTFKKHGLIREQEPCDDAISREELLKAIDTWDKFGYTETGCFVREPKGDYIPYIHFDDVIKCIKGMPSVTQKSGEWIKWWEVIKHERSEEYISHWKCSVCGKEQDPHSAKFINFCPRCGAEMVEPQESEE